MEYPRREFMKRMGWYGLLLFVFVLKPLFSDFMAPTDDLEAFHKYYGLDEGDDADLASENELAGLEDLEQTESDGGEFAQA